jgi:hypothetical protein
MGVGVCVFVVFYVLVPDDIFRCFLWTSYLCSLWRFLILSFDIRTCDLCLWLGVPSFLCGRFAFVVDLCCVPWLLFY